MFCYRHFPLQHTSSANMLLIATLQQCKKLVNLEIMKLSNRLDFTFPPQDPIPSAYHYKCIITCKTCIALSVVTTFCSNVLWYLVADVQLLSCRSSHQPHSFHIMDVLDALLRRRITEVPQEGEWGVLEHLVLV